MLEVSGITKKYGKTVILKDISFVVKPGECVAVVGLNGSGKTTLMQILAGALKPDGGEIKVFGENPLKNKKIFREYCGYVPQELPLLKELTVKDNLKLWGADKGQNYEYILERFELKDILGKRVDRLSGGMKRRLGIATAIAAWPPILLLDEPSTALDIYYKDSIREWLKEYCNLNGMVVWSTHEEAEIVSADRCLLLNDGHLIEITDEDRMTKIREIFKENRK